MPGDPNGPADETYNCRCTVEFVEVDISNELRRIKQELKEKFGVLAVPIHYPSARTRKAHEEILSTVAALGERRSPKEYLESLKFIASGLAQINEVRRGVITDRIDELGVFSSESFDLIALRSRKLFGTHELYISDREVLDAMLGLTISASLNNDLVAVTVSVNPANNEELYQAAISPAKGSREVNYWAVRNESDLSRDAVSRWTARHELGHVITDSGVPEKFKRMFSSEVVTNEGVVTDDESQEILQGQFMLQSMLGRYAQESPREAFAEAFAWYTSTDYPRNIPYEQPEAEKRMPREIEIEIERALTGIEDW